VYLAGMSPNYNKNVLKHIFVDHWPGFQKMNPRYKTEYYDNEVREIIKKYLSLKYI